MKNTKTYRITNISFAISEINRCSCLWQSQSMESSIWQLYYSLDLFNSHLFSAFCCIQDQLRNLIWMRQKWSMAGEWWVIR